MRDRCAQKIEGGKIIKVEAHPIPEHKRARRVVNRAALVGKILYPSLSLNSNDFR